MKRMRLLAASIGAALLSLPAQAVVFTNYTLSFDSSGVGFVVPNSATAPGEYQDIFTFTLADAMTFSGSLTTQRLRDEGGTIVSDLDFGNSIDGVSIDGGVPFNMPDSGTDALETVNLGTTLLAAGTHTLTVNYTVDTASAAHGAAYAGPVQVAAITDVPEPSVWAMFLCGFGLIGAGLRRKPRVSFTTI